jgi:hypothetical protein
MFFRVAALGAIALALLPTASAGGEQAHAPRHHVFHDSFYKELIRPDTGNPCCNDGDCWSTSGRMIGTQYDVMVKGAWVKVPWHKIVRKTAPDFGYHVCAPPHFNGQPHQLYCVVLPPES